jgi:hypothetical protein
VLARAVLPDRIARLMAVAGFLACSPSPEQENVSAASGGTEAASSSSQSGGGEASSSTEALQKATQNPVANLISVPLQDNTNFSVGPYNGTQNVLNIQPVIPVHLTPNWNLINRVILPVVWQPYTGTNPANAILGTFGLGDLNPTVFLSPAHPGKVIWGVGPAFVFDRN